MKRMNFVNNCAKEQRKMKKILKKYKKGIDISFFL